MWQKYIFAFTMKNFIACHLRGKYIWSTRNYKIKLNENYVVCPPFKAT